MRLVGPIGQKILGSGRYSYPVALRTQGIRSVLLSKYNFYTWKASSKLETRNNLQRGEFLLSGNDEQALI